MSSIVDLKDKLKSAREDLTTASAIVGEVKESIRKELDSLTSLGVPIPECDEKEGYTAEYLDKVKNIVEDYVDSLSEDIDSKKKEIEEIIEKWEV